MATPAIPTVSVRIEAALLNLTPVDSHLPGYTLVFCAMCAMMGFLAVVLDVCLWVLFRKSILKISHGLWTLAVLPIWTIASALMGYFALILEILQPTLLGALTAGLSWSVLAVALAKISKGNETDDAA